jgi:osmotically-inducible protein OsmY
LLDEAWVSRSETAPREATAMNWMTTLKPAAWTLALALGCAACDDGPDNRANDAARDAGKAAGNAAKATGEAAADAARATGDAVANAGRAAEAAVQTMDVKTALMRDSRVDASDINVDTNHETKTVVLKGRVASAAQKTIAEQIAIEQAKGYRVQNDLTVR